MSKGVSTFALLIGAVIIAGASFYAGALYSGNNLFVMTASTQKPAAGTTYASSAVGTLTAHTASSVTLMLPDGTTKSFAVTPQTQVLATVAAGQQAPTLATLPDGVVVSLSLSTVGNTVTVTSITLAPSWSESAGAATH